MQCNRENFIYHKYQGIFHLPHNTMCDDAFIEFHLPQIPCVIANLLTSQKVQYLSTHTDKDTNFHYFKKEIPNLIHFISVHRGHQRRSGRAFSTRLWDPYHRRARSLLRRVCFHTGRQHHHQTGCSTRHLDIQSARIRRQAEKGISLMHNVGTSWQLHQH